MEGRTVIAIAHRLSTLRAADKIIVIKDGIVAEEGTAEELLEHDGVYAHLHHLQFDNTHELSPRSLAEYPSRLRRLSDADGARSRR
jgi:ABC-type multidrug transport system ATPase subunit